MTAFLLNLTHRTRPCPLYDAGCCIHPCPPARRSPINSSAGGLGPHGVTPASRSARNRPVGISSPSNAKYQLPPGFHGRHTRTPSTKKHARDRRPALRLAYWIAACATRVSFGDRAVTTLNTHAQRRRASLGEASDTQGVCQRGLGVRVFSLSDAAFPLQVRKRPK
jgi:hypothetical protein